MTASSYVIKAEVAEPEAELDFKLYRQATNKIVGISERTAVFLRAFF